MGGLKQHSVATTAAAAPAAAAATTVAAACGQLRSSRLGLRGGGVVELLDAVAGLPGPVVSDGEPAADAGNNRMGRPGEPEAGIGMREGARPCGIAEHMTVGLSILSSPGTLRVVLGTAVALAAIEATVALPPVGTSRGCIERGLTAGLRCEAPAGFDLAEALAAAGGALGALAANAAATAAQCDLAWSGAPAMATILGLWSSGIGQDVSTCACCCAWMSPGDAAAATAAVAAAAAAAAAEGANGRNGECECDVPSSEDLLLRRFGDFAVDDRRLPGAEVLGEKCDAGVVHNVPMRLESSVLTPRAPLDDALALDIV